MRASVGRHLAVCGVLLSGVTAAAETTIVGRAIQTDVPLYQSAKDVADDNPFGDPVGESVLRGIPIRRQTPNAFEIKLRDKVFWVNRADVKTSDEKERTCEGRGKYEVGASRGIGNCPP